MHEQQSGEAARRDDDVPHETEPRDRPRIYVASLSDYNAGRLNGAWIWANQPIEEVGGEITAMLARSPEPGAEEWAIHDFENFGPYHVDEYESLERECRVAGGISRYGLVAFAAWASLAEDTEPETLARFEDACLGEWSSLEDYADQLLDDLGAEQALDGLPEWLQPYVEIDVAGFARDLELGGDVTVVDNHAGGVWLFEKRW